MSCGKIICVDRKPREQYKLFFGDAGSFLRIDRVDYPVFKNLYESLYSSFWTWKKFDFTRDRQGWERVDEIGKRMFKLNNSYQSLMDSGVVNIYNLLTTLTSNTELNLAYSYIANNESIHAASYSYGLSQMFGADAEGMVDIVYTDVVVKSRLENEVDFASDFIKLCVVDGRTDDEAKKALVKAIISAYLLEHIKFPYSFLVTWSVNKAFNKALESFSLLLVEIAHDELTGHVPVNGNVLKILRREERQGFSHLFKTELDEFIIEYTRQVVEQEISWNSYLFSEGNIPGFTEEIGASFIRFYADKALKLLGFEPLYNERKNDVIEWYDTYRNSNNKNVAAQESQNVNYQKGCLVNDFHIREWTSIK